MTRATPSARTLARGLCAGGLACVAVITLVSPGATRMFAWPWTLFHAGALLTPALALIVRAFDREQPLRLPARGWWLLAGAFAGTVLAAALTSPYRGPSLLWSAPLFASVAVFFLLFDWLQEDAGHRAQLHRALLLAALLVATASMGCWLARAFQSSAENALGGRNPFPLGHSNYTAGLALLMLPVAAGLAFRQRGAWRGLALVVAALALAMLFTSGSRGGFLGLAALSAAAVWSAPFAPRKKFWLVGLGLGAAAVLALAHPRTRATLFGGAGADLIAASGGQRTAMLVAGLRMGADRPFFGWGHGTTPLAFPRYRAGLAGGVENVLQLHSAPVQVWAELGAAGLACLLAFVALAGRHAARDPVAACALLGYGALALTDWQLDVPVFAFAVAAFAALLETPAVCHPLDDKAGRRLVGVLTLAVIAVVALVGQRDPAPELNVRALALARDPANTDRAISLLRASLALNPDQEIAHFNLGWLLVVRDPAAAARHFLAAARLVPDKGGVYFGLGLARLNQGHADAAARAFALECLNDPRFLASPWWREPAIAATRDASARAFADYLRQIAAFAPPHTLNSRLLGVVPAGPERTYRRERTGYPVLMRNLDLPPPLDLYDVREPAATPETSSGPLPEKGWLPSPLLLTLLDTTVSPKP